ncbi:MAG: GDSL-type esterase/lipase family protein [Pseudomonadota bacterium]|nr:GDSL-type esterase/lipase family protein [Pseudomonadota bacterium]
MLIRLEQDVLALNPAAIILLIGTNDLEERASPEVIAANVSLILEAVADFSPTLPVVLCDVMPSSSTMNRPTGQIQQVNALLAELADDYQNVISFDTFSLFADDEGNAKPAEFPDLLHPNETAYLKWADALRPVLSVFDLPQK